LRDLRPIALDRFCGRILAEIGEVSADASRSNHERYRAIWELLRRRDDEIADGFNDVRRSTMVMRLCALRRLDLLTDEEFARLTEETRDAVQTILGIAGR
jgi:hypothetical protein